MAQPMAPQQAKTTAGRAGARGGAMDPYVVKALRAVRLAGSSAWALA